MRLSERIRASKPCLCGLPERSGDSRPPSDQRERLLHRAHTCPGRGLRPCRGVPVRIPPQHLRL
jgi:hypothetical protein